MKATQAEIDEVRRQIRDPQGQREFDAMSPEEKDHYIQNIKDAMSNQPQVEPKASPVASVASAVGAGYGVKKLYDAATGATAATEAATSGLPPGVSQILDPKDLAGYSPGAATPAGGWEFANIGAKGNYLLPVAGVIGAGDVLLNDYGPVRGGLQGAASGAAIGSYYGPPGALIGAGIGGAVGLGKGLFKHESTADVAKKHTSQLKQQGIDDETWQAYLGGMRGQHSIDPRKPFGGGKYSSWDEYKAAGLDSSDLTGVYGNLKAFGPDWSKLTFDQQKAVTQKIIDAGLYHSKMGEVEISDESKARQLYKDTIDNWVNPSVQSSKLRPSTEKPKSNPSVTDVVEESGGGGDTGPNPFSMPPDYGRIAYNPYSSLFADRQGPGLQYGAGQASTSPGEPQPVPRPTPSAGAPSSPSPIYIQPSQYETSPFHGRPLGYAEMIRTMAKNRNSTYTGR